MIIETINATTLEEYSAIIFQISKSTQDQIWFRGQAKAEHLLSPSLLRKASINDLSLLKEEEEFFRYKFDQRGRPYVSERNLDEFEKLFIMQHYGFPTRLLDWSENPFIGLYFALNNNNVDGAIYLLKPSIWNECSLESREKGIRRILNSDDEFADSLKPSKIKTGHQHAVSMYATHNTTRIIAQRGVFTIFGASLTTMDKQYEDFPDHEETNILTKIIIPSENKVRIRTQLYKMGITESVVFPDLEHLAQESKRNREYPV